MLVQEKTGQGGCTDLVDGSLPLSLPIDDIIVFSKDRKDHMSHLEAVLQKVQEARLAIKKCQFIFGSHSWD